MSVLVCASECEGALEGLRWSSEGHDDFIICHSASRFCGSRIDCLQSVAGTFAHTLCMHILAMLAATVVVPCLSAPTRAPGSSGSGVVGRRSWACSVLRCAVLLCVYLVFMLLRYFEPNSCPALPSDAVAENVDPFEDDAEVEAAVQKMLGLIGTVRSWPGFTSSITCCALLKTTLTATDSTHRCNRVPRQSTVTHRDTLLRSHSSGLQGTQWMQNYAEGASCTSTLGEISPRTPSRTTTCGSVRRDTSGGT